MMMYLYGLAFPAHYYVCAGLLFIMLGQERLPTFADRARMPYVEALVAEVLRWAPPIPLSAFFYITFSGGQCSLVPLRLQPRARRLKI